MKNISIPVDALNFIHQWLPFEPGILYPFIQNDDSPNARLEAMLTKGGFLNSKGKVSDEANNVFKTIAESSNTVKLKFLVEGDLLDYQVFFSKDKKISASLKRGEKHIYADFPAPTDEILEVISDFSGMSSFGVISAKWILAFSESIALAAIVDIIRMQIFASLANNEDAFKVEITQSALQDILNKEDVNSNWLVWAISSYVPDNIDINSIDLEKEITSLCEKKLIKMDGTNIIACDEIIFNARRLLHINCLYMLDVFNIKSDANAEKARLAVIQNGVRDLLLLETDGNTIAWQGISGKAFLSLLHEYLSANETDKNTDVTEIYTEEQPPRIKVESNPKPTVCPSCNSALKPNAKFCTKCGNTI